MYSARNWEGGLVGGLLQRNRPLQPKLEQGKRCEKCHVDIKLSTRSRSTRVEAVERHDEVSVVVGPLEALVVVNA